jgi:hypothetical protein
MIKTIEAIVFISLLIFSFFLGVRYSNTVKENVSWLQTKTDEELELPNLSNELPEAGIVQGPEGEMPPMDNLDESSNQLPAAGSDSNSTQDQSKIEERTSLETQSKKLPPVPSKTANPKTSGR